MTNIQEKLRRENRLVEIRLRRDLERLDDPVRAGRWRNLYFAKDGRTRVGEYLWPTADAAKARFDELAHKNAHRPDAWGYWTDGSKMLWSEISHAIQMPAGGGE